MIDACHRSCAASTPDDCIRGTDEMLTETEGAGAMSATRSEVARGRDSQAEVARQIGVSRQTVVRWKRAGQDSGIASAPRPTEATATEGD